ncbi:MULTISPECIES: DUF1161 domain-containing protein [Uliginosibacterium]|uniref:DUF1161 domain-containing protein n=1 Tax=Uliginosibacterium aquaticum TaxID=2731212 RepID=A0ABX2IG12_9RHOO|nr:MULTISPECIES: DUF1161 domain-containing protein [Uliginosibacterium]MDO6388031.1 DUF1161 domain-containing protein [Uliginosibacterium sp. 31-12]NSL54778.1 DUF1161 domain-containing protein [Uliginosibacterium aquaticum]PLK48168.1 hypothetical protein C0V76_13100 [Uliginosibacterium sp. TH139]
MKQVMAAVLLTMLALPAFAAKDCAELKGEIEARIQSHGVKSFTLEIVEKGKGGEAKVVGACEGGTKEITYVRQ